ncbi:hypothetical protein FH972_002761 [Carpinus fangiana]|uniref:Uncharacterized protein n=1 Tax=Carpinus fangiana TaxID=176857 RepID=A0A5N6QGD0_9ROSI|nr:hypothetical protein FH972_002761 [Carpinus fangiana]
MDRSIRITTFFLLWFTIVSLQTLPAIGGGQDHAAQNQQEKPSIAKIVKDKISVLAHSNQRSWNKIRTIMKQMFKGKDEANGADGNSAEGKTSEAAEKSFETSKNIVEGSAKLAGKVVGEAMHKMKETVEESMPDKDESEAEL